MRKLPETLFIAWNDGGGDPFLSAERNASNLIDDDGPTLVGTYRRVKQEVLRKEVHSIPADRQPRKRRS